MTKRILIFTLLFIILSFSFANSETMYVKNQNWTNCDNSIIPDYTYSILCEDEKVEVISTMKYMFSVWEPDDRSYRRTSREQRISSIIKNNRKVYIKRSDLTTKKPKYTYTIRNCNKEFVILSNAYLYEKPTTKSNKIRLESSFCAATIGQTNKWYQVYYHGKPYFIRKNSKYINLYAPSEVTGNCLYYLVNDVYVNDDGIVPLKNTFSNRIKKYM